MCMVEYWSVMGCHFVLCGYVLLEMCDSELGWSLVGSPVVINICSLGSLLHLSPNTHTLIVAF